MKSRVKGRNYEILESDNEIYPTILNKKATDKKLAQLSAAMKTIQKILKDSYDSDDYSFYRFVSENIFDSADINCDDGRIWHLNRAIEAIKEIQETLATHNDEIKPPEYRQTLSDLGFKKDPWSLFRRDGLWEKEIEKEELKEITEEILITETETIHRMRTLIWEKIDDHGKRSKSITYRKLPISKKLQKVIDNTIADNRN